jgi:dTDP-4-dehydrorhamnose 3,5-epimerase
MRTANPNTPPRKDWLLSTVIEGVTIKDLKKYSDERGWLVELFRNDWLPPLEGQQEIPVMAYLSHTLPGVQRGPHEHVNQTDVFAFLSGTFMLELWDNRPQAPTYRRMTRFYVGNPRMVMVVVPPGVVHGYKNVGKDPGLVFNAPNALFKGHNKADVVDEIRHETDPNSPFYGDMEQ